MIKLSSNSAVLSQDGKVLVEIIVDNSWRFPADEIAFHSATAAYVVYKAIPLAFGRPIVVHITKSKDNPRVLFQRGPNEEYIVELPESNQAPSIAFAFGHELGHIIIDNLKPGSPQMWFEETFCEAFAIWTLQRLSIEAEKIKDPFFAFYSEAFSSEAKRLHWNTVPPTEGYSRWFTNNRNVLNGTGVNRELNNVLAIKLIEYANEDPSFFQSFLYLRTSSSNKQIDTIEWVLKNWRDSCPEHLKSGPNKVAKLLGIKIE